MKKILQAACLIVICLFPTGCDDNRDDHQIVIISQVPNPVTVKTNKASYIRNEETVITISNGSEYSIGLGVCESNVFYYRDRLVNDQWVTWTKLVCFTDDLERYVLESGASLSDSIVVSKPGTYQFWYVYSWLDGVGKRDTIYSNTFTIY